MKSIKKFFFVNLLKFTKIKNNISFKNLNFRNLDFTNYNQIRSFIFKKNFYQHNNKYVESFDFLNYSKNLGGEIGINLSRKSIFAWFKINKNKMNYPWSQDLTSKRLRNLLYNYEFINSSSNINESKMLNKIIYIHMRRVMYDFNNKKINQITSFDIISYLLSYKILKNKFFEEIDFIELVVLNKIDSLSVHKSYNIIEHAKFLNNLNEMKAIYLFFDKKISNKIEEIIVKMTSVLNQYFHLDGSIPLFNGSNNNYTKIIYESLNKEEYLIKREFENAKNGIAFYANKNKKVFFDVVQPNDNFISKELSAGTLSFEFSGNGEKIITNCGASESLGANPEYLRYSAAHSTIILQNTNISEIKSQNPHIKYPQSVKFISDKVAGNIIFEGSHNGYVKRFKKIIKRKLIIHRSECKISGEDSIISIKDMNLKIIYHIRFHLMDGFSYNFTNNKKNIILKSKFKNMWLFKSDSELSVEDSILVDNNTTNPTKQIVIKGVVTNKKLFKMWSLEKI